MTSTEGGDLSIGCCTEMQEWTGEYTIKLGRYPFWIRDIDIWRGLLGWLADLTSTLALRRIGASAVRCHYWRKGE